MKSASTLALTALVTVLPVAGITADNPYAGQEKRPIKALSEQEIADYLNGRGMGSSKAAELNHYPGPRHVLEHAAALGLTPQQADRVRQAQDAMDSEARRIGRQIVDQEAALESLYASQQATPENTQRMVREIASLQAAFRMAHLNAHLSMKQVLSPEQVALYDRARGYDGTKALHHGHKQH